MAELTVQDVSLVGLAPAYQAVADGDYFVPASAGKYMIHVKNAHTSSWTVTINDPISVAPSGAKAFDPDVDVVVPNATERMILIDVGRFKDPSTNRIDLAYTGLTALTIGVFRLP